MKKKTSSIVMILLLIASVFSIGFATWIISFDKNFDANYTPQVDVNINNLYDQKLTYNGKNQTVNTSPLGNIINDYNCIISKDGVEVSEVKDAGLYVFNYSSSKQNFEPFNINLTIEPINVDVTFNVSYNGKNKEYVNIYDIKHYDTYVEGQKVNLSAKITGILANDECNVILDNFAPFDFGVNKTFNLSLDGKHKNNYNLRQNKVNIVAKQKVIFKGHLIEIDYDSTFLANNATNKIASHFLSNKDQYFFNEDGTPFTSNIQATFIKYLHNGTYVYPTNYKGDLGFTPEICESTKMVGSTYEVHLSFNNSKFEFIQDKTNLINDFKVILKYKTAKIGNTFYTIEDAFNASGTISFAGDSSANNSFVPTAFTALDYYGSNTYELNGGRKLIVPYNDTLDERNAKGASNNNYNTFACLYIPKNIVINCNSSSTIAVAAEVAHAGVVGNHGTMMVNGILNLNNSILNSYGYIKGKYIDENTHEYGIINSNSSIVQDVISLYSYSGGKNVSGMNGKIFPISSYSFHNISATTKYDKNSKFNVFYRITAQGKTVEGSATMLGNGGLFSLNNNGYIIKKAKKIQWITDKNNPNLVSSHILTDTLNEKVIEINQDRGEILQKEIIELYGNFSDNKFVINFGVGNVETSENIALPLGLIDIYLKEGKGSLSKNSYRMLPGSKIEISPNATLSIDNPNCKLYIDDSNFKDNITYDNSGTISTENTPMGYETYHKKYLSQTDKSFVEPKLINNGVLLANGGVGGKILTLHENATTILSKDEATIDELESVTYSKWYISSKVTLRKVTKKAVGFISNGTTVTEQNFTAGSQYNSIKASDGTYHWSAPTTPKKFTVNYYDKDTTTPTTVDIYMNSDTSSLTGDEYIPTKLYYDFDNWYLDSSFNTPFAGRNDIKPDEVINLYAKYNLHEYKIIYNFGYNDELIADTSLVNGDKNQISFTFDGTTFTYWTDVNNKKTGSSIPLPSGYTYTLEDGSIKVEEEGWHVGIIGIQLTEEKINVLTNDQFALWVQESGNADLYLSKLFVDHTITIVGKNGVSTTFGVMDGTNLNTLGNNNPINIYTEYLKNDPTHAYEDYTTFIYNGVTYQLNGPESWDIIVTSDIEIVLSGAKKKVLTITFIVTTSGTKPSDYSSAISINGSYITGDTPLRPTDAVITQTYNYGDIINIKLEGKHWKQGWFGSGKWENRNINYYQIGSQQTNVNANTITFDYTVTKNEIITIDIQA